MWVRPLWFSAPQLLTHLQISFIVLRQWQMHVGVSGATVTKRVRKNCLDHYEMKMHRAKKSHYFRLVHPPSCQVSVLEFCHLG